MCIFTLQMNRRKDFYEKIWEERGVGKMEDKTQYKVSNYYYPDTSDKDYEMIIKAINFATKKHEGQVRKGTDIPYIVHPMETMTILRGMNADTSLLIAGVLHDVVEDTDTTIDEIQNEFGKEVADLVGNHSEDKSRTWQERKETDIEETQNGSKELKMLVMADKVSNLRALYRDVQELPEKVWERFNASKKQQSWYYSKMIDVLGEMQYDSDAAQIYWEMGALYKDIFVTYYFDRMEETLYQKSVSGECYGLDSGNPEWYPFEEELPEGMEELEREKAEQMEDTWADEFYKVIEKDLEDADYAIYSSESRSLTISVFNGEMKFKGEDFGEECEKMNGSRYYEFIYELGQEDTYRVFYALRKQYVLGCSTEEILLKEFGSDNGSVRFTEFCDTVGASYHLFSF